jgi:hypothetical protein
MMESAVVKSQTMDGRSGVADHRIVSTDSMSRGAAIMDDRMVID